MLRIHIRSIFTISFIMFGFFSVSMAKVEQVPRELTPAFEHLISFTTQADADEPDAGQIAQVIDFVNSDKNLNNSFSMGEREGATSNYSEFCLNRSLKELLNLVYNPDIPAHITSPASIRRAKWLQVDGKCQGLPLLSQFLSDHMETRLIKGVEFIENTPDTNSGAYYAYELDRALLLTRHNGNNVLISISHQRKKSAVGKKGVVLGSDDNWDYLYTGEKGCTLPGLSWVNSYMYDSASITVYCEERGPSPRVRCGVFKWIRAGWAGVNMVQAHHIRQGISRFAKTYKQILESPILADTSKLSKAFRKINDLSEKELRQRVQQYYLTLKKIHQNKSRLARRWFDRLVGQDGYVARMKPDEMKALLSKAYLKYLMGKPPGIDIGLFLPSASKPNYPG